jgi:hypothetical protein
VATSLGVAASGLPASAAPDQPVLPPGGTFLDDDRSFAEGAIEAIAAAGITAGCAPQLFCPDRPLSRAEAAVFLARALEPDSAPTTGFPDVARDDWYAEAVFALAGAGIITGHTDGTFRPTAPLTRAQMAQLLIRALDETAQIGPGPTRFIDVSADAPFATAIEQLALRGITHGCATEPARFCPGEYVSRAQMAVFLTRALALEPLVPPDRIAPLNGLPVNGLAWNRRVVAVKIDDHRGARPQSGIEEADAVVETLVEGGLTRWIALFHQSDSSYLGPVRSVRPTDIGIVLPLDATVAASGGQQWIVDQAVAAGIQLLRRRDAPPPALYRIPSRPVPHNLYADTTALRDVADGAGYTDHPPPPLFEWGEFPDGPAATRISLEWSDPITVTWTWDGARYLRERGGAPHLTVTADGLASQIWADSLVVLIAPASDLLPPPEVSGSPVPVLDTVGVGTAFVFAEGRAVRGTWSRTSLSEPFTLSTFRGDPLPVPPGVPWINVFPEGQVIRS